MNESLLITRKSRSRRVVNRNYYW